MSSPHAFDLSALGSGWAEALAPQSARFEALAAMLDDEAAAGHTVLPPHPQILRALNGPLAQVRVVIIGQDPYPTPGHAHGLAFSTDARVAPLPRSLRNVFTELVADIGGPAPISGDLSAWAHQGVLLLNRVLTVRAGDAGSHRGRSWEEITEAIVDILVARPAPLVAILWGADAARLAPRFAPHPVVVSAHPSPLSARRGFFGSRPFTRANAELVARGAPPVDWRIATPRTQDWFL